MPEVFDNVNSYLKDSLRAILTESHAADFCVGYFHIRGWGALSDLVERLEGDSGKQLRILVGMNKTEREELEQALSVASGKEFDMSEARRRHTELMKQFQAQLTFGLPSNDAFTALQNLNRQLCDGKVAVKLFTRYPLHAKLYLLHRPVSHSEMYGIVGSSNLTGPGLYRQGELNVDVQDQDACGKLHDWFLDKWDDRFSVDVTLNLQKLIAESWAREELVSPYLVYMKIVYHLAHDALTASLEYQLPKEFRDIVLDFQENAILRVRRNLRLHPIAILADVVGMGKTLAASAVVKLFQMEEFGKCVVCCPVKLERMWREYMQQYDIAGEVVPYSQLHRLADIKGRCKLVLLDESHNLRNRETKNWATLRDYIRDQDAKVLLLSATPYNKHYEDLGNQLRLALDEKSDLGVRPEAHFRDHDELEFAATYQAPPTSLVAFEQSEHPDDWADLLKRFMVRRTRDFIVKNYSEFDEDRGRNFIELKNGVRSYFPKRVPITLKFPLDDKDANDQYGRLFNDHVVDVIDHLSLPRYGIGGYIDQKRLIDATPKEKELLDNLSTAGERLIGYCRTNLLKRLESSGHCFLLSLERHALRNYVFVHARDNGLDLPIGSQSSAILDTATSDADADSDTQAQVFDEYEDDEIEVTADQPFEVHPELAAKAKAIYTTYELARKAGKRQFKWISSRFFNRELRKKLMEDADALMQIVGNAGEWIPERDAKLRSLADLLKAKEKDSKVLVFTQFADTADYLGEELKKMGVDHVEWVTAASGDPYDIVSRFSPDSNRCDMRGRTPVRVLIATEVLSEGQNCQDASVVVNYDLPWAIIRLIQRAGRVDRIGQDNAEIRIYSCLPDEGVERHISLRSRLVQRLKTNKEVVGTDEQFFEEEEGDAIRNLYAEDPNALDAADDSADVDIASQAEAIWNAVMEANPDIEKLVKDLPNQVFATRDHAGTDESPQGVITYFKTADGYDSLCRIRDDGKMVSHSLTAVLKAAMCGPETEAQPTNPKHHNLVQTAVKETVRENFTESGGLGHRRSARRRVKEILSGYRADLREKTDLFSTTDTRELDKVIDDVTKRNLTERSRDIFNRLLREGISPADLCERAIRLREENELTVQHEEQVSEEPVLICSLGLFPSEVAE